MTKRLISVSGLWILGLLAPATTASADSLVGTATADRLVGATVATSIGAKAGSDLAVGEPTTVANAPTTYLNASCPYGDSLYRPFFAPVGNRLGYACESEIASGEYVFQMFSHDIGSPPVLASMSNSGEPGNGQSDTGTYSPNGRYLAFWSLASNLVPGDTNEIYDVYIRDLVGKKTIRMNIGPAGLQPSAIPTMPTFTPDSRYALFGTTDRLVTADTNASYDVYVKDLTTGSLVLLASSSNGAAANRGATGALVSASGSHVAFSSTSSNLLPADTDAWQDVYVKNRSTYALTLVSRTASGTKGNADSSVVAITPDGTEVLFASAATNLFTGDTNEQTDYFIKNMATGSLTRLPFAGERPLRPVTFSRDGRYILVTREWTEAGLFDRKTSSYTKIFGFDGLDLSFVRFSPDETKIIWVDYHGIGNAYIIDIASKKWAYLHNEEDGRYLPVRRLSLSGDGSVVVMYYYDRSPWESTVEPIPLAPGAADKIYGNEGADTIFGAAGNDELWGGPGSDVIHGGTGTDTAKYVGGSSNFVITRIGPVIFEVRDKTGREGTDVLSFVERVNFAGTTIDLRTVR